MLKSLCYFTSLHSSVHLTVIWFFSLLSTRWDGAICSQLWVFPLIFLDISSRPDVNVQDLRKPILAGIAGCLSVHMPKVVSCWGLGREFLYQEQYTKSQKYLWRREKLTFLQGISYLQLRWGHAKGDLPAFCSGDQLGSGMLVLISLTLCVPQQLLHILQKENLTSSSYLLY